MAKKRPSKTHENPIQEAVLEVRFSVDNWDVTSAGELYNLLSQDFPDKQPIHSVALVIGQQIQETPRSFSPPNSPVLQLWKSDKSGLVQLGPGLVTANVLKYSDWSSFGKVIKQAISAYLQVVKPTAMHRISARYINRFEFPQKEFDLKKYFTCNLILPPSVPQVEQMQIQVISPSKSSTQKNKLLFATAKPSPETKANHLCFVLDIDSYMTVSGKPTIQNIEKSANALHSSVKDLFFSLLAPSLRSKYSSEEI